MKVSRGLHGWATWCVSVGGGVKAKKRGMAQLLASLRDGATVRRFDRATVRAKVRPCEGATVQGGGCRKSLPPLACELLPQSERHRDRHHHRHRFAIEPCRREQPLSDSL